MIQESFDESIKKQTWDSDIARNFSIKKQQQLDDLSPKEQKLLRNKISAKNCRLKKKNYVTELQQIQKNLEQQIKNTEEEIEKTKQKLNIFMTKHKSNDSFNHDEKPTYEKLKFLIRQEGQLDQDEANMLIQLLINRIGVTGRQRKRMVQYYSNRLINFSIPAIYRYLLITSSSQSGFFKQDNLQNKQEEWHQYYIRQLNLTQQERMNMIKIKQKMVKQNQSWSEKIRKFKEIKSKIYNLSTQIQQSLLPFREILSVKQCGQIIIGLQNRKYNKQTLYGDDDELNPDIERLTKKIKIN